MLQQNLYFIAIIPPDDICEEVIAFKHDLKENYNSKAALKNVPHITLKAPFKTDAFKHADVIKWFKKLSVAKEPFVVQLHDFGCFPNPDNPVIYVQPVSTEPLKKLQAQVIAAFEKAFPNVPLHYHEHKFAPHITIAFRDLAFAEFKKAWQVYSHKIYNAAFRVHNFYLLQHNGSQWEVIAEHSIEK